jgi:stage II sporulation protein D
MMLTYDPGGGEGIFLAQYSACCGGTVNSADVLRNVNLIPPLTGGQHCDDCAGCPRYRWPAVRVSKADVHRALAGAYPSASGLHGAVTDVRVASTTPYGRILWLDVIGRGGTETLRLRADDLRLALLRNRTAGLYSMNCQVRGVGDTIEFYDGHGFGHGVGLCQWGAEGKAQKGWTYDRILNFYYPGARLTRAY